MAASSKLFYEMKVQLETSDSLFIEKIEQRGLQLDLRDEYICILLRQRFTSSETAVLMGMSPQALSNKKKRMATKLSGGDANAADLDQFLAGL